MGRIRLPYHEGSLFGIPLKDKAYGIGLVARSGRSGKVLLGYFFRPERRVLPRPDKLKGLTPSDSVLVCMFGDLGLINGSWPIIGDLVDFSREDWPMPLFSRVDDISGKEKLIRYSENEPIDETECRNRERSDSSQYPPDGSWGYRAVEIRLSKILCKT